MRRAPVILLAAGAMLLALGLFLSLYAGATAMPSYLADWLFWSSLPLGALPVVMLIDLAGTEGRVRAGSGTAAAADPDACRSRADDPAAAAAGGVVRLGEWPRLLHAVWPELDDAWRVHFKKHLLRGALDSPGSAFPVATIPWRHRTKASPCRHRPVRLCHIGDDGLGGLGDDRRAQLDVR